MRKTVIVGVLASMVSVAAADRPVEPFLELASPTVTEIKTDPSTGYRAVVGFSGKRSFLTIERVSRGRVVEQIDVQDIRVRGRQVPVDSFATISLGSWKRGVLELGATLGDRDYTCSLSPGRNVSAKCWSADGATYAGPPPADPAPSAPTMAELNTITESCSSVFTYAGTSHRDKCIASASQILRSKHKAKVVQVITTCQTAFTYAGFDAQQSCIATAARGSYDPIELVAYCQKNNMYAGFAKQQQCIADLSAK